jgi:RNA polymerase sigma-70 factor (ECF subfamily)
VLGKGSKPELRPVRAESAATTLQRDRNAPGLHSAPSMEHAFDSLPRPAPGFVASSSSVELPGPVASPEEALRPEQSPVEVQQTLGRLFIEHHALIWRTLRRLGAGKEAAADFTQQAYVIAAERFFQIRPGCERAFLFSTAVGLAHTSRRREWRCLLEADMEPHAKSPDNEDVAARKQYARQLIDRVLMRMDTSFASVFVLFEFEELSSPEIAEMLDIPLGTVASRLRRARQIFKYEVEQLEQVLESDRHE